MQSPSAMRSRDARARRLLRLFEALDEPARDTLLRFAEFLAREAETAPAVSATTTAVPEPRAIPRPAQESVIGAIRRLADTYFMLDKDALLNETSSLMAQHVMQGRSAVEVIDELERLFREEYERLLRSTE